MNSTNEITAGEFSLKAITDIRISVTNRKRFDQGALQFLAKNIADVGIVQPILIRPVTPTEIAPEPYEIVAGERRYRGATIAGLAVIPTMIRTLTDNQAREIQLLENLQREDPHPMEEAEGFQELMLQSGYTADQLAEKLKKSRSHIYGRLKLCALANNVREQFLDNAISASTALLIARIPVPALQIRALEEISKPQGYPPEPMSYRRAVQHIQDKYMMDLTQAKFLMTDAKLLATAGACSKCPKKTGNQPEIYPEIKSADVCTDPACFAEKRAAHDTRTIADANKSGVPVYEGKEAETLTSRMWDRDCELVKESSPLWKFERNAPATRNHGNIAGLIEKDKLPAPAAYIKSSSGELITLYQRSSIQTALEAAGACETVEAHAKRMAETVKPPERPAEIAKREKQQQKMREEEKAAEDEEAYRIKLYKQLRHRGANGFSLASLREFTKLALTTHELPDQALAGVYTFDTSSTESIHAYIDQAALSDVQLLLVDMLLGDCLITDSYYDEDEFKDQLATMHTMAKHEGIDPDHVRSQLEMGSIALDALQEADLGPYIEAFPERLNDLGKFILAERPLLINELDICAKLHGFQYGVGGFSKSATSIEGDATTNTRVDADQDVPVVDVAASAGLDDPSTPSQAEDGGDYVDASDFEEAPAPAEKKPAARAPKAKAAAPAKKTIPLDAWPFPKSKADSQIESKPETTKG